MPLSGAIVHTVLYLVEFGFNLKNGTTVCGYGMLCECAYVRVCACMCVHVGVCWCVRARARVCVCVFVNMCGCGVRVSVCARGFILYTIICHSCTVRLS
jgi:hypothetical protein